MKVAPLPISSYYPVTQPKPAPPTPRFQGVGQSVSKVVEVLDSNPMFQLFGTDLISMVVPRSILALSCRGEDDGRETFLREFSGLIGNVLLMGWTGYAAARTLGDSVNFYNPMGLPARAWVPAQSLEAFGNIYREALNQSETPQEARNRLIDHVLNGLESGDRHFSIESRLTNLEQLEDPAVQKKMLQQMQASVADASKIDLERCQHLLDAMKPPQGGSWPPEKQLDYEKLRQDFKSLFLEAGWGKLSQDAKNEASSNNLKIFFQPKAAGNTGIKGTVPFDRMAQERTASLQESFARNHGLTDLIEERFQAEQHNPNARSKAAIRNEIVNKHGFDAKTFIKQRLTLSLNHLREGAKDFSQAVDREALLHGLTSTVELKHTFTHLDQPPIQLSSNRSNLLKELKFFLEQFVDRTEYAAHQALQEAGTPNPASLKKKIDTLLFAPSHNGFWNKMLPKAEDGLVTAAMKSKGAFTWIPLVFSVGAAGALTFYNNHLTMQKHGGKVFFPGEGMPPVDGALKAAGLMHPHPPDNTTGASGPYRNFGSFPNYPQFRNSQGGIIA